jgi:hypothetical protein
MARRQAHGRGLFVDALVGAASGLVASWLMEQAQARVIADAGGPATRARERQASAGLDPATVQTAQRAARLVGRSIPEDRKGAAGEVVHYATGAAFGALYGVVAGRLGFSALLGGALFGAAVWLVNDEALVPALGLSRPPWDYPASAHAKALASHLVYGAATGAGVRLAGVTLH